MLTTWRTAKIPTEDLVHPHGNPRRRCVRTAFGPTSRGEGPSSSPLLPFLARIRVVVLDALPQIRSVTSKHQDPKASSRVTRGLEYQGRLGLAIAPRPSGVADNREQDTGGDEREGTTASVQFPTRCGCVCLFLIVSTCHKISGEVLGETVVTGCMGFDLCVRQVATLSFTMTFLAEWGDRSQIATIAMATTKDMWGVTVGGILGHGLCTGMAVVGGRMLAAR